MSSFSSLCFIIAIALVATTVVGIENDKYSFVQSVTPTPKVRREKTSHFRFYWQDLWSGKNPTAAQVASAPISNQSTTGFGTVVVIDNALTEGPELSSKLIGRAQGIYVSAGKDTVGLLMSMNFHFIEGKYNGSTLAVLGRNQVFTDIREMPVVGGSGLFRFARGYCQAHTHKYNPKNGDATVEYNVHVIHY